MQTMDDQGQILKFAYIALAALSGAFTALSFVRWKDMSRLELVLTFGVGFTFAIFVTPWFAHGVFRIDESNTRAVAALTYVFGSGSNILLPTIIRWVKRVLGQGDVA